MVSQGLQLLLPIPHPVPIAASCVADPPIPHRPVYVQPFVLSRSVRGTFSVPDFFAVTLPRSASVARGVEQLHAWGPEGPELRSQGHVQSLLYFFFHFTLTPLSVDELSCGILSFLIERSLVKPSQACLECLWGEEK